MVTQRIGATKRQTEYPKNGTGYFNCYFNLMVGFGGFFCIPQRAFSMPSQLINLAKHTDTASNSYSFRKHHENKSQKFKQIGT